MAELTKEWLQKTIAEIEDVLNANPNKGNDIDVVNMLAALKIAQSSLRAEAVLYMNRFTRRTFTLDEQPGADKELNIYVPLYAAPPAHVPVMYKGTKLLTKEGLELIRDGIAEATGLEAMCMAEALLSAPPTADVQDNWISCSERMPEKGQNVLISVNFDSSLVEPLICSARYTGSTFRRGDATIKPGNGIEQATHWMPLPEPPQEVN
ncbi:DUF551 domain-containing protein [Salmonella enterica subsp. salamae serovar 13,22:z:-]|nr:DUF551 domain-containing protein [Salmonella enterica subsp. salamae serovar 13,22:z:-]